MMTSFGNLTKLSELFLFVGFFSKLGLLILTFVSRIDKFVEGLNMTSIQ